MKAMADAMQANAARRGFVDLADLAGFPAETIRKHGCDAFVLAIHGQTANPNDPSIAALRARADQAVSSFCTEYEATR